MKPLTLVTFGDSLTYGYGVLEGVAFPPRLKEQFPDWEVINKGINGDTSREALTRLSQDVFRKNPQLVTVFFGANDSSLMEGLYRPLIEFEKNMRRIVEQIMHFSHGEAFNGGQALPILITPPPVVDTDFFPFTTTDRVAVYANAIKEISREMGCPCVDFFSILWAKKEEAYEDFFQFDGVHLSNQGYDLLYPLILEEINKQLKKA